MDSTPTHFGGGGIWHDRHLPTAYVAIGGFPSVRDDVFIIGCRGRTKELRMYRTAVTEIRQIYR